MDHGGVVLAACSIQKTLSAEAAIAKALAAIHAMELCMQGDVFFLYHFRMRCLASCQMVNMGSPNLLVIL